MLLVSTLLRVSRAALCDATDREAVLGGYYSTRRVLQYPAGITVLGGYYSTRRVLQYSAGITVLGGYYSTRRANAVVNRVGVPSSAHSCSTAGSYSDRFRTYY